MIIDEAYDIQAGRFQTKAGKTQKVIYINPVTKEDSDLIFSLKNDLKKFGAVWFNSFKKWGWFYDDASLQNVLDKKVHPALQFMEKYDTEKRKAEELVNSVIAQIENSEDADINTKNSIKDKLENFKTELLTNLSSDEFFEKMQTVIDFGRMQGHRYSFMNTLLIFIQDPEATSVKSKSGWERYNREVVDTSHPIFLIVPRGQKHFSKEEKEKIKERFLKKAGVSSEKELGPGEKERLTIALRGYGARAFDYEPYFYDIRYTKVMDGKEDVYANAKKKMDEIPWYDDSTEATPETEKYCDAMMEVIKDSGVKLTSVDSLNGARGVSMSGEIQILKDTPHNKGFFQTLCHEFSHELLHQQYLKSKDKDLQDYFVGKPQGRAVVEQQAEISAWIVLRNFGFEMPTSINYAGIWGLRKEKAAEVFDTVAKVAEYIISNINEKMGNVNEGRELHESITGLDVAKMVGAEDVYLASKRQMNKGKKTIGITREDVNEMVKEAVDRILKLK